MSSKREYDGDVETIVADTVKTQTPKNYKVILLNDDYTPMDFVVSVLESIFQKSPPEAVKIMLQVHQQGRGVCGIYTKQIAETKVELVQIQAADHQYPLQCIMEETE